MLRYRGPAGRKLFFRSPAPSLPLLYWVDSWEAWNSHLLVMAGALLRVYLFAISLSSGNRNLFCPPGMRKGDVGNMLDPGEPPSRFSISISFFPARLQVGKGASKNRQK